VTTDGRFDADALVVGMSLVPDLFSRNRMYSLFEDPVVRHARSRARLVRSVLRDLKGTNGPVSDVVHDGATVAPDRRATLRYRVKGMKLDRSVELSPVELAVIAFLCDRAGVTALAMSAEQRAEIDRVLARLPRRRA
jgi:hypothetical protein